MTTQTQTTEKKKPTWRLVQDKVFYKSGPLGQLVRDTSQIEVAVGWDETGRESRKPYISWSNSVVPVLPDVDGRIALRAFPINHDA
ncbi:hypothetical protein GC194_04870 [bacterium]|nr:hypothetical protein [bacterium]